MRARHSAMTRSSIENEICAYEAISEVAKNADFLIADYAHILNPYTKKAFLKRISHKLEDAIVIWDEAHNVIDAATSYLSSSISTKSVAYAAKELSEINSSIDLDYLVFALKSMAEKKLTSETKEEAFIEDGDISKTLIDESPDVAEDLEKAGLEYLSNTKSKRSTLLHLSGFLKEIGSRDDSSVRILSKSKDGGIKLTIDYLYPEEAV